MLRHLPQPTGGIPVKLPYSLRDRHMYIIGRSGSGKTNLIRLMALQDITDGHGIGMLAPEQELLTEEILPYIPEERIDDVVYFNPADTQNPILLNPLFLDEMQTSTSVLMTTSPSLSGSWVRRNPEWMKYSDNPSTR
jgi:hypothetical protein